MLSDIPLVSPETPLLNRIDQGIPLRDLNTKELTQLTEELRAYLLYSVGQTGGHFGAGLGVVELTVALHHIYDALDRLCFVVVEKDHDRKNGAVAIEQSRRCFDRGDGLREGGRIAGKSSPFERAFVPARVDDLGYLRKRKSRLDPVNLRDFGLELVDLIHDFEVDATIPDRLDESRGAPARKVDAVGHQGF